MRKILLTILVVILGIPMLSQEIQLRPTVLSAGGSSSESPPISWWRLSQVHMLILSDDSESDDLEPGWQISAYPNPVEDILNIKFDLQEAEKFRIRLTDILGRTLLIQEEQTVLKDQVIELDLSGYCPASYLLHIVSLDRGNYRAFPVQMIE